MILFQFFDHKWVINISLEAINCCLLMLLQSYSLFCSISSEISCHGVISKLTTQFLFESIQDKEFQVFGPQLPYLIPFVRNLHHLFKTHRVCISCLVTTVRLIHHSIAYCYIYIHLILIRFVSHLNFIVRKNCVPRRWLMFIVTLSKWSIYIKNWYIYIHLQPTLNNKNINMAVSVYISCQH